VTASACGVRLWAAAIALTAPQLAYAQNFEKPPSFDIAKLPGIAASGENYRVASPASSDGFLRIYKVGTRYGELVVQGDHLLRMRLVELAALSRLEKLSDSESFNKALMQAGVAPVKYAGEMLANPVGTLGKTLAGVGNVFGQVGAGMKNAGKTPDDPVASALGVTKQKRQLAVEVGVDPYTDYEPLKIKLNQLSGAAAAGNLVVTGAMVAIPGAAGIVVSNVSTANKLGEARLEDLARDYTAAQIFDLNRQRLAAMGVDKALADAMLANRNYTPIDLAAITAALDSMAAVRDRAVFVARAAEIGDRSIAIFMRAHAELLAAYYAKTGAFTGFVSLGGYPFCVMRDGGVLGLMPIDALSWTQTSAKNMQEVTAALKRSGIAKAELRITGQATALAKRRLKELGWTVADNVRI
jgi:hypothetical protein